MVGSSNPNVERPNLFGAGLHPPTSGQRPEYLQIIALVISRPFQ